MARNSNGQFARGSSGNPSGRPKRTEKEIEMLASLYDLSELAVETVHDIMTDKEINPSVRLKASEIIIDRICGKVMDAKKLDQYDDLQMINELFEM